VRQVFCSHRCPDFWAPLGGFGETLHNPVLLEGGGKDLPEYAKAMRAWCSVERPRDFYVVGAGVGVTRGSLPPEMFRLNFGNSGTVCRLVEWSRWPGCPIPLVFDGTHPDVVAALKGPMRRVLDPLGN